MRLFSRLAADPRHLSTHTIQLLARRGFLSLATLALLTVLFVGSALPAAADDRPPGGVMSNPVVRAIDLASPAVVRIATLYNARLTLAACGAVANLPPSGGSYTVGGLGSGAFVSAHGDILTADHVVDIDRQSLNGAIFAGADVSADVATFLNAACHPNVPITPIDVASGIVQFNGLPFSVSYSAPKILVWRSASYLGIVNGSGSSQAANQLSGLMKAPHDEAQVLKTSSFTADDVALVHVNLTDTPNIQLDPSNQLAVEDALAVIGFPGNGDVNGDPTNLLTPSVNNVSISALKRNDNGSQLIQVGGNVEHGDSGGPALDSAGHIVGIVSFGGVDVPGITAFLRSSDSALTLIKDAQIDTTPGAFQQQWQRAFADYTASQPGHWRTASRELDTLSTQYPDFHGIDAYRQYADAAAIREANASAVGTLSPRMLLIGGAVLVVVLVVLALLLTLFALRKRASRRARQQAQAQSPVWQNSFAAPSYNGYDGYNGYNGGVARTLPPTPPSPPSPYPAPYSQPFAGAQQSPAYAQQVQQAQPPRQPVYAHPGATPYPDSGYPSAQPTNGSAPGNGQPQSNPSAYSAPAASSPGQAYAALDREQSGYPGASSVPAMGNPSSPTISGETCINGHAMAPWSLQCPLCGAERRTSAPAARDASNAPQQPGW